MEESISVVELKFVGARWLLIPSVLFLCLGLVFDKIGCCCCCCCFLLPVKRVGDAILLGTLSESALL